MDRFSSTNAVYITDSSRNTLSSML